MNKKNVLFFCCDQFLWNALGYAGHSQVKTPNLDRLAAVSTNFPNTFCASPVCVPARISLFTGQYPHNHGQNNNHGQIKPGINMFMECFQDAGYHTGSIGKLHFFPLHETKRFDYVKLHDGVGADSDYTKWLNSVNPEIAKPERHSTPKEGKDGFIYGINSCKNNESTPTIMYGTSQVKAEHYYTQWISDNTISYLDKFGNSPFFLNVSFYGPHSPFFIPEPYKSMYDPSQIDLPENWQEQSGDHPQSHIWRHSFLGTKNMSEQQLREIIAIYYGHISLIDEHIGKIIDHLEETGLSDNTIIAFSADHGEMLGNHGLMYKGEMYDEACRIPLLIHDAEQLIPATRNGFVSQIDIIPALLDLTDIQVPEWSHGRSMKKLLKGNESVARAGIFAEIKQSDTNEYTIGYRTADYLFVYKIKYNNADISDGELYDLQHDASQTNNLFNNLEYSDMVNQFKNKIILWLAGVID